MNQKEKKDLTTFLVMAGFALIFLTKGAIILPALALAGIYYYTKNLTGVTVKNVNTNNFMNPSDIKKKFSRISITIVLAVILIVVGINTVRVIPPGHTGVQHLFGKVNDKELSSGLHIINPLVTVYFMSVRTEQYTMSVVSNEGERYGDDSIEALTKEGLKVSLDMTVLYHLIEEDASEVYKNIGLDYDEKILRPEVRSAIREIIALYEAKDIYSEKRDEAVEKIEVILKESLSPRGIEVESVLLRNVKLPPMLASGIEEKLTAEQEAQKYDFILQTETKEADRKRIEATGQRDAQKIINESLSSRYIQYLYVQNLEKREGTIYVPYDMPLLRGI